MSKVKYWRWWLSAIGPVIGLTVMLFFACRARPEGKPLGATYAELGKAEVWKVPSRCEAQVVGLKSGDVIIAYNEEPVASITEFYQLEKAVTAAGGGNKVKLNVLRDDQELSFEVRPVELGFVPWAKRYSASMAKALDDILQHNGQPGIYDWLAALTGESFALMLDEDNCYSWGTDGLADMYLTTVAKFTGLVCKVRYNRNDQTVETAVDDDSSRAGEPDPGVIAVWEGLAHNQDLLVLGRWGEQPFLQWGVVSRIEPKDSTVYGWAIDYGTEQALSGRIVSVYDVEFRNPVKLDPAVLVSAVLEQALELGLRSSDQGWHSGLEAYDILLKKLEQFPVCPPGVEAGDDCFYRLVWRLIAKKESANRFFAEMKEALPEQADLFDEVIGRNRAIIGKLEGVVAAGLSLNSLENQQKAARVLAEIQEIENELLGIYEEIIGEL
jgi:hypothetical protein